MNILFRVDSSTKIGIGHVMRCLTLAQVLKDSGSSIEFVCRKLEGNLIEKIRSSGFFVYELEVFEGVKVDSKLKHSHWLGVTQQQDADDCIDILKAKKIDWLIIDHYALDEEWQKKLKYYCESLMVIDDLADRKHQCNVLLDQNFGRNYKDYEKLTLKSTKLLMGAQYALLRPEFEKWRRYSLDRRKVVNFKSLLINMGGTDPNNITERVIEKLQASNLPKDIVVTVVMGETAPYLQSVKACASKLPYYSEVKVNVDNMAEIMANTDIAIGASGSTTWERCCLGVPTIQLITAYNQEFIAQQLDKINAIKLVDIKDVAENLENFQYWIKDVSENAKNITNGAGVKAILRYLL